MRYLVCFLVTVFFGAGCALVRPPADAPRTGSLAIVNGWLIDGSGAPMVRGHLLVEEDRITAISVGGDPPAGWQAATVIDAAGKVVTPGFIDTHAHGDPLETPAFENFLAMGVTTICLGQDGSSPRAEGLEEWMRSVDEIRPGVNVMMYIGHGTVRNEAGVGLSEEPSAEEIARMVELVEMAMEAGCFGMTTGLEYQPGTFSELDELIAVAGPVAARDGVVMSHMRSEDDDVLEEMIGELVAQGRGSGARVHVSHIKSVYGKGAARAEEILRILDTARNEGVHITADLYPYTASHTGIAIVFPDFALPPNDYDEVVRTQRDELAAYLRHRVTLRNGPEATLLSTGPNAGKTLAQVADERGMRFEDVLIEMGPRGGSGAYFVMDEVLQGRLLQGPYVNVCSDGSPGMRHPRGYGSFAKIIHHFVNEKEAMPLEEAVRKMTSLSAENSRVLGEKRGLIRAGYAADLLIFDPAEVRDTATFEEPHQLAEGFDTVIVNGVVVRRGGAFTGERAGRMLRAGEAD